MGLKCAPPDSTMANPGPGNYEHKTTVLNVPCMKFPNSPRADLASIEKVPGPGSYKKVMRPATAAPRYGFGTS